MATKKTGVTRLTDMATGRIDAIKLDPKLILIEEDFNPRDYALPENRAHLDELKDSILEHGVEQPLWVRFDTENKIPYLVDGECRLRAVLELIDEGHPIESVTIIQKSGTPEDRLRIALTANTGKALSQWEVGKAYLRLQNYGWAVDRIAKEMGQKKTYVTQAIEFATSADKTTLKLLSMQAITPSLALATMRKHGDKASLVLETKVKLAVKAAEAKQKKAEEKAAAKLARDKAAGKKTPAKKKAADKPAKPAKAAKPVTLKREKAKSENLSLKPKQVKLIVATLEMAKASDDKELVLAATEALKYFPAEGAGDVAKSLLD